MTAMLYQNIATLSGLMVWYGVLVLMGAQGRWRWLWPLAPLFAGWCSFRALGWYLGTVHPFLAPAMQRLSGGRALMLFIQDVGLREELIKLLFALPCMLWLRPRPAAIHSALLTAAFVGLGFATAENRWFFGGHVEPTLLVGRVFSTTALHMAATALCGAALTAASCRSRPWSWFCTVLLSVVVAHGLYDWAPASTWTWLRAGGTSWLSQGVVIALMVSFFGSCRQLQSRTAQVWFILGVAMQYSLAMGITWLRWGTPESVWICARECLLFLPTVAATAVAMVTVSLSKWQA